ncbi:hypothetical protein NN561_000733 [Cricetulus griseus]
MERQGQSVPGARASPLPSQPARAALGGGIQTGRCSQRQISGLFSLLQRPGATCPERAPHSAGVKLPQRPLPRTCTHLAYSPFFLRGNATGFKQFQTCFQE